MKSKSINIFSTLAFLIFYGLFVFALSPMLFIGVLPIRMVILFLVMMTGPSFLVMLFVRAYLLEKSELRGLAKSGDCVEK